MLPDTPSFTGYRATGYQKERKRDGSKSLKCRKQPSWAQKNGKIEHKVETKLGDRFVLYLLGGVTYSELREIHAMASEHERDITVSEWLPAACLTPCSYHTISCVLYAHAQATTRLSQVFPWYLLTPNTASILVFIKYWPQGQDSAPFQDG